MASPNLKSKEHWVHLRLNDADFDALRDLAAAENISHTEMVRRLIRRSLRDGLNPPAGPTLEVTHD